MHTCMYVCVYICIHVYMCTCIYIHIIFIQVTLAWPSVGYVYVCICIYVCMYVCICVYMICIQVTLAWPSVTCSVQLTSLHDEPSADIRTATKVSGRLLLEIDSKPAFETYRTWSGIPDLQKEALDKWCVCVCVCVCVRDKM